MIVRLASFGCYLGMKMMVIYSREEDDDWVTVATLSSHSNTVWDLAWDPAGCIKIIRAIVMMVVFLLLMKATNIVAGHCDRH